MGGLLSTHRRAQLSGVRGGEWPGVELGVIDGQVPDPVAVGFDDDDGALGQHALDPGEDLEKCIDTFINRVADAAQQQDARPSGASQCQDGAEVGVGGDEDALVSDGKRHHLVVGVPGSAEDPDMGGSCPAVASR